MNPLHQTPLLFLLAAVTVLSFILFVCASWQFKSLAWKKKYLGFKANAFLILSLILLLWSSYNPATQGSRLVNAVIFSSGLAHFSFAIFTLFPPSPAAVARNRALLKLPFLGLLCGLFFFQPHWRMLFFFLPLMGVVIFLYIERAKHPLAFRSALFMFLASLLACLTLPHEFEGVISWLRFAGGAFFLLMALVFYDQNLNYFFVRQLFAEKISGQQHAQDS